MVLFVGNDAETDESSTPAIIFILTTPFLAASIAFLATINQSYVMLCAQALMFGYLVLFGLFIGLFTIEANIGLLYLCAVFLLFWGILFNLASASRSERRGSAI